MEFDERGLCIILKTYGLYLSKELIKKFLICLGLNDNVIQSTFIHFYRENGKKFYYLYTHNNKLKRLFFKFFMKKTPIYRALLPHITFFSENIEPLWIDNKNRILIGWLNEKNHKKLLVGLNVVEEIIRYRQGDPNKVKTAKFKGGWGFDYERADYLFEEHVIEKYMTVPWADYLGFFIAEKLACITRFPLVMPLPQGAKGAILLTGDDDQAYLEKYKEQLKYIKNIPITYFLHPLTRHTSETLKDLPDNVDFGVHPDALNDPENYDKLCKEQVYYIRNLTNRPIRSLRNHGFLNKGYLGYLKTWEECDIKLDLNYGGVNGKIFNASFLPMRVRRPDNSWSKHYSLITAFGDGMIYALNMTCKKAITQIRKVVKQIENHYPGVIVFNFHPQNIEDTKCLLNEVVKLSKKPGWIALKIEEYIDWLETLEELEIKKEKNYFILNAKKEVKDLALKFPTKRGWKVIKLEPWEGKKEIKIDD